MLFDRVLWSLPIWIDQLIPINITKSLQWFVTLLKVNIVWISKKKKKKNVQNWKGEMYAFVILKIRPINSKNVFSFLFCFVFPPNITYIWKFFFLMSLLILKNSHVNSKISVCLYVFIVFLFIYLFVAWYYLFLKFETLLINIIIF